MVGAGIGVKGHRRTAAGGALGEFLAGLRRRPDVLLSDQDQQRNRRRPVGALLAARAGIEGDRGPETGPGESRGTPAPRGAAARTYAPPPRRPAPQSVSGATPETLACQ